MTNLEIYLLLGVILAGIGIGNFVYKIDESNGDACLSRITYMGVGVFVSLIWPLIAGHFIINNYIFKKVKK